MTTQKDKYDLAVEYLTEHPEEIVCAWFVPSGHTAGCLFQFASRSGKAESNCGCLTAIRGAGWTAETENLTQSIRADRRIPTFRGDITPEHLPIFAEWQRRIDKELGREA